MAIIPEYAPLFINSNNKIHKWSIRILQGSNNSFTIETSHGDLNGKQILHTTDISQARPSFNDPIKD